MMDGNNPSCSEDQLSFLFADDSGAGSEEGGGNGVEEPVEPIIPRRSGSKRARPADLHNLSEKMRRCRINEKMKELQNLIPNSTKKTDKASMLDEAIEYLKQLQLQVQMLSMRNGLTAHPMYLSGDLQTLQTSNLSIGYGENKSATQTGASGILPLNPDSSFSSLLSSFDLTSQCTPSHPTVRLPTTSISGREPSQANDQSFQEAFKEGMESQQQLDSGTITRNPSGC